MYDNCLTILTAYVDEINCVEDDFFSSWFLNCIVIINNASIEVCLDFGRVFMEEKLNYLVN